VSKLVRVAAHSQAIYGVVQSAILSYNPLKPA